MKIALLFTVVAIYFMFLVGKISATLTGEWHIDYPFHHGHHHIHHHELGHHHGHHVHHSVHIPHENLGFGILELFDSLAPIKIRIATHGHAHLP